MGNGFWVRESVVPEEGNVGEKRRAWHLGPGCHLRSKQRKTRRWRNQRGKGNVRL